MFIFESLVLCSYSNVMKSCWQEQPEERPTFSELVTIISTTLVGMVDYLDLNSLIMWNIGMAKETRSGCLVRIVL